MKVSEAIDFGVEKIKPLKDRIAVEVILSFVLDKSKEWIFVNSNVELGRVQEEKFLQYIEMIKKGKPVAQITGRKEFYGRDFFVNENVLVPRPESEMIVRQIWECASREMRNEKLEISSSVGGDKKIRVLEVGVGSGCILLSILKEVENSYGVGVDVSDKALEVAKMNRKLLELDERCELVLSDLLEKVSGDFDFIVANLPYIGRKEFNEVEKNVVDFEPEVALFGGDDGLDLYRRLFKEISEKGIKFKLLLVEFGIGQEERVRELMEINFPEMEVSILKDLAGIARIGVGNAPTGSARNKK